MHVHTKLNDIELVTYPKSKQISANYILQSTRGLNKHDHQPTLLVYSDLKYKVELFNFIICLTR